MEQEYYHNMKFPPCVGKTMAEACFLSSRKEATIFIGAAFTVVSLSGLMVACTSVLHYLPLPDDPLIRWLLHLCFFLDVEGILFQGLLFVASIILAYGAALDVAAALVSWIGWSPFVISGLFANMVVIIIQAPDLALPITSFAFMLMLLVLYSTVLVLSRYLDISPESMTARGFIVTIVASSAEPLQGTASRNQLQEIQRRVAIAYWNLKRATAQEKRSAAIPEARRWSQPPQQGSGLEPEK